MAKRNGIYKKLFCVISTICLLAVTLPTMPAHAAQVTSRKLSLTNSAPSATGVGYTLSFTAPTATTVKSVNIDICDSVSNTCTPSGAGVPAGLSTTGAAVGTITGIGSGGSWTGTFTTNGRLRIANNTNTGSPTTVSLQFTGVTNPSAANSTFFARITTYSDSAWTTPIDSGTVAASTANQISITGTVDESLTFCTGTSGVTNSSCAGATGATVNLGSLSAGTTGSGTSQIGVTTNAGSGYAITTSGTTLTSGANTITALSSQTASTQGTSQFGLNLKTNTTPAVGSDPAGAGSGTPTATYGTANQFRFVTGDQVASTATADSFRLFTVSYIANVGAVTPAGSYATNLTYICTATF